MAICMYQFIFTQEPATRAFTAYIMYYAYSRPISQRCNMMSIAGFVL